MPNDLINGVYRLLGEIPEASRHGLHLAHSLVTGELVVIALPGGAGSSATELSQEADIFGDIAHPNIHRIVDRGGEEVFIAWEYVPARPLTDALEAGRPVAVGVVLRLLSDIGNGLGALHSRGSVYRGLHPGRILVSRDRRARLATCPDSMNTGRGRAVGIGPPRETPIRYLPPEQIEGSLDSRADIYTAAAIGYELLTGRRLYANADPVTLAVQILKMSPEPPSTIRADVPREVDDFLLHCLARDPGERPAGATAFLGHLRKLIDLFGPDMQDGIEQFATAATTYFPLVSTTQATTPLETVARAGGFASFVSSAQDEEPGTETSHPEVASGDYSPAAPDAGDVSNGRAYANGSAGGNGSADGTGVTEFHPNGAGESANSEAANANGARHHAAPNVAVSNNGNGNGKHDVSAADPVYDDVLMVIVPNGASRAVTSRRLLVGRGETVTAQGGMDLAMFDPDQVVSRNHAELLLTSAGWVCRDLSATNGTFLNGDRLPPKGEVAIRPGDVLGFASVKIGLEGVAQWATS